ncbi:unnamed protein product [Mesocestoides corti]|uniref:EGF-like domain-containing protein n=2 Tax=Mesocestoides corti TaxID=53468 RepID=A0A3P6GCD0_MESCO|nr:unnamed protein product [Mesocestoides corti]
MSETLPPANKFDFYRFTSFIHMNEPKYKKLRYGFPPGVYGSSLIPVTLWFVHWSQYRPFLMIPNFSTMVAIPVDWFLIVRSCDEILLPRCSWAHFINFMQPLQLDLQLIEHSGTVPDVSREKDIIPYLFGNCWPIRSVEQVSLIYIYAVCTVYWNVTGFDREVNWFPLKFIHCFYLDRFKVSAHNLCICPQPCASSPCSGLSFARAGSCKAVGIHERDFESTVTCICRLGYMGHDCSEVLDACLVGSDVYNAAEVTTGPIIPPGREACEAENNCIPQLGTPGFSCECDEKFAMDRGRSFDNCLSRRDPCSSRICIEGTCIASEDGSWSMCDCEEGFTGELCNEPLGAWTAWSALTPCEPYCGEQRLRRRVRVCSGDLEEDCIGAVEHVRLHRTKLFAIGGLTC